MLLLRQGVVAAEGTARADFAELDANVTDWDSERAAANLRFAPSSRVSSRLKP